MFNVHSLLSQTFTGAIWRLEIDELTDNMALETRDEQKKQVSFSSVNLITGKVNFIDYQTDERWLAGIETIYKGVIILHYYKHENSPEHKGIIAVDALTKKALWSNYTLAFNSLTINGPVVYNASVQPKKLFLIDAETGNCIRTYNHFSDSPLLNNIAAPVTSTNYNNFLPLEPYGNMVHYHHVNNYIIVSLHALTKGKLQQHLYVLQEAAIVYHDLLNDDIQKLQPEAFIVHKNRLVYIKNKSEIKVLAL